MSNDLPSVDSIDSFCLLLLSLLLLLLLLLANETLAMSASAESLTVKTLGIWVPCKAVHGHVGQSMLLTSSCTVASVLAKFSRTIGPIGPRNESFDESRVFKTSCGQSFVLLESDH